MKISETTTEAAHLLYDAKALQRARAIAVLVPGAFSRTSIFDATRGWESKGYGIASYRFPGLDGRADWPALNICEAAREIADLAAQFPDKPLRLLGFSTGAPIVLSAAMQMAGDVKVAAMSPAVERGGGRDTYWRGVWDIAYAALRARTFRLAPLWYEYYRVLLFGRVVHSNDILSAKAQQIIDARRSKIVVPDATKRRAHTSDLRRWTLPPGQNLPSDRVRFFWGEADPVFSRAQIDAFSEQLGGVAITRYRGQGHLLFASHPPVFDDIFGFFEGCS